LKLLSSVKEILFFIIDIWDFVFENIKHTFYFKLVMLMLLLLGLSLTNNSFFQIIMISIIMISVFKIIKNKFLSFLMETKVVKILLTERKF